MAEFVYSYQQDILIKTDAINVVKVLDTHSLIEDCDKRIDEINNNNDSVVLRIMTILRDTIPSAQIGDIMEEYYGVVKK